MTETTTTEDEAAAGDDVAVGDGGDGIDEHLELAAEITPEGPIKDRLLIPLILPWLCIAAVALYALNVSRIFLAGDSTSALIIGTIITVSILLGATIISASPRLRTSSLAMIMGFVLVIVVSGGLLTLGPSLNNGKGGAATGYVKPKGPPTSTVSVAAGPGLTFNGVAFKGNYTAKAGVIEIDYGGVSGHTLVFTDPKLAGFELATSATKKGNVELKPGTYTFYCNVTGHRALGMQATLTVS
jgi:plastocyanin